MITAEQIQAEHEAALASLTPQQRWALSRLQRAAQCANFNHRPTQENLKTLFEAEAEARSKAELAEPELRKAG